MVEDWSKADVGIHVHTNCLQILRWNQLVYIYTGCPSDMTENILLGLSPHYAVWPDVVCASQSSLGYTVDCTRVSTTNLLDVKTACVSCLWKPAVSCCSCRLAPAIIMSNLEESSTRRVVNWKTNFRFRLQWSPTLWFFNSSRCLDLL